MPRSIEGRLFLLSALLTLLVLATAGWALVGVLERFATRSIDRRLDAQLSLLASVVDNDGRIDRPRLAARAGALEHGYDWRWRITGPRGSLGSADLPLHPRGDQPPRPPAAHPFIVNGLSPSRAAYHSHALAIPTRAGPVTVIAAVKREAFLRPVGEIVMPLLAVLALLGTLLAVASVVQLRLGLKPLRRFQEAVVAIRSGVGRTIDEDQAHELQPLAAELNALAADNNRTLSAARLSAANLAHALKTPVAILGIATRDRPDLAVEVGRIDTTIRHHLARARSSIADVRAHAALAPLVADVALATARIHAGRGIAVTHDVPADLAVRADPTDLTEMIGNLMDNAGRFATSRVSAVGSREGRTARLTIRDDGPGMSAEARAATQDALRRMDERGGEHGFGLAITRDLAALYGGKLELVPAPGGGLDAVLTLPLHTETPAAA